MAQAGVPDVVAAPNQTVYVNNLNEKIKKEELKKSLYHVFSQFGNVLEIHADKRLRTRGQAWIIFDDLAAATKSTREMQGFTFYGKPMRVSFSKAKSDVVSKIDGTFQPRPKRKIEAKPSKKGQAPKKKKETKEQLNPAPEGVPEAAAAAPAAPAQEIEMPAVPNKILFVENLPPQSNSLMLSMLFQQYQGYKEARLVPGKPGIAFVEFEDEYQAGTAKDALQGFKITPVNLMKISFAKK